MGELVSRFLRCRRGQGVAEYSFLLIFLSVGAAASSVVVEQHVTALLRATVSAIAAAAPGSAAAADSSAVESTSHFMTSTTLRSGEPRPVYVIEHDSGTPPSASTSEPVSKALTDS